MKRLLLLALTCFAFQARAMEETPTSGANSKQAYASRDALRASALNLQGSNGNDELATLISKHFNDKTLSLELYETYKNNRGSVSRFVYDNQKRIIAVAQELAGHPASSLAPIENCYVALTFFFDRVSAPYCDDITELIAQLVKANETLLRQILTTHQNSTVRNEIVQAKACADMLYCIITDNKERVEHTTVRTVLANQLKNGATQKSSSILSGAPELLISASIAITAFACLVFFKTAHGTGI